MILGIHQSRAFENKAETIEVAMHIADRNYVLADRGLWPFFRRRSRIRNRKYHN